MPPRPEFSNSQLGGIERNSIDDVSEWNTQGKGKIKTWDSDATERMKQPRYRRRRSTPVSESVTTNEPRSFRSGSGSDSTEGIHDDVFTASSCSAPPAIAFPVHF